MELQLGDREVKYSDELDRSDSLHKFLFGKYSGWSGRDVRGLEAASSLCQCDGKRVLWACGDVNSCVRRLGVDSGLIWSSTV